MKTGSEKQASKYAKALLESLVPADFRNTVAELNALATVFADPANKDVVAALANPVYALSNKTEMVESALRTTVSTVTKNVLLLLIERGSFDLVNVVAEQFEKLVNAFERASELHVTSARELSEAERSNLQDSVKKDLGDLGGLVQFHFVTDASLLGGMQVRAGDKLLDSSVKGAVDRMFEGLAKVDV